MGQKCVIYTRYSSDRQREESIEGQIRVCEDYAKRNGLEVLHIYADRAMTGRSDQRPEFQMMIRDAASMTFDVVLVYKLNRFARNRYDSAKYKHKLKKYSVKVVSAMENIADDPSGILLESVIEGMAEYYSAELAENVMRGMTENALGGKWPGGIVPLGYKLDNQHHLVIDEPNAKVVRLIYQMAADNHADASIIRYLNSHHYLTAVKKPFGYNSLTSILRNERYIGIFLWKNIKRLNTIPPIIDEKLFYLVQAKRKARRESHVHTHSEDFLLTGKLFCGLCGGRMVGTSGTSCNKTTYRYYTCTPHKSSHSCSAKNIRADKLEDIVCRYSTKLLSKKEAVSAIAKQAMKLQAEQKEPLEMQSLKRQIVELNKKVKNCVQAIENGLVSDTVTNHIKEYENKLKELNEELSKQKLMTDMPVLTEKHIEFFFLSMAQKAKQDKKYRNILLSSIIRSVVVYKDYIEIQYNYEKELPTLQNPVRIRSSDFHTMVGANRIELLTFCL